MNIIKEIVQWALLVMVVTSFGMSIRNTFFRAAPPAQESFQDLRQKDDSLQIQVLNLEHKFRQNAQAAVTIHGNVQGLRTDVTSALSFIADRVPHFTKEELDQAIKDERKRIREALAAANAQAGENAK